MNMGLIDTQSEQSPIQTHQFRKTIRMLLQRIQIVGGMTQPGIKHLIPKSLQHPRVGLQSQPCGQLTQSRLRLFEEAVIVDDHESLAASEPQRPHHVLIP
ncbi:hypothetical protein D0N87_28725, partial [Pseudomonas sp. ATCC 13867]